MSTNKTSRSRKSRQPNEVVNLPPIQPIDYASTSLSSASSSSSAQPGCMGTLCLRRKKPIKKKLPMHSIAPADNQFTVYLKNSKNKWAKNRQYLNRDDLYNKLNNDRNAYWISSTNYILPESIFSNWISNDENSLNDTGSNGNAGYKVFIKLPIYNIFITLNSYFRIQKEIDNKEWFALPILNGEKIRIGNMFGSQSGSLHGEKPGYKVYKLYTKTQIERGIDEVEEDDHEYDTPLMNIRPALWEEQLYSSNERKNCQTNDAILKVIKSVLFVVPNSVSKCNYMTMEQWGNPFRIELLTENDITIQMLINYYDTIYVSLYKLFEYLNTLLHVSMEQFINILSFIYNYYGKSNNTVIYTENSDIAALTALAAYIVMKNDHYNMEKVKYIIKKDYENYTDSKINEIYMRLKSYYDESQYGSFRTLYQLIYECPHLLAESTLKELLRKQESKLRLLEGTISYRMKYPLFFRLTPAQQALHISIYILQKSPDIFKIDIEDIPEEYLNKMFNIVTSMMPRSPIIRLPDRTRYTMQPISFW